MRRAREVAAWYHQTFGDDYYIEIQNNGLESQRVVLEAAADLARHMGIPLVATSDVHYVLREDHVAQDVLLCINTGKFRTDEDRMRMETDQFYLRSPEEMYAAFPGHEEAVARSQQIADQVDIELELGRRHFPVFHPPEGESSESFLRRLCIEGLKQRYADRPDRCPGGELSEEVMKRLERELEVICKLGFANYFLIVWDFVRFARQQGIPAAARGSGVGSLVSYALYLSHVCPLEYDLLFERFLDENRREAPDIDIDFCQHRRGEVIQYVKEKYGKDNVAQIGTFGTLAARAAIRDVGRALGHSVPWVDKVVAMVPEELGITLEKALKKSDSLRQAWESDAEVREVVDLAMRIEGLARNVGTHAAAVVIADRPLTDYVPLQHVTGKEEVITQWSMGDVERAGLLKMDFLGLRNLTILSKTVSLIEQTTGRKIDPYKFPLDDQATFELLCRGETKGIFQLESSGIRELLQRMRPDQFRDIIAVNALYRPGPLEGGMVDDYIQVKHGRKEPEYPHPVMKEVLEETHGVMVYQEQVMRILNRLGGIDLANAYTCIKAISKKKHDKIVKFREQFIEGAHQKGLSRRKAEEIFALIEKFAGYGFNKSHSTAYALVAYMTAYLKAHYPVEFMAALLSSDIPGRNFKRKDSLVEHLEDCQRMGIEVRPPDVNHSGVEFTVSEGKIYFGLSAIKGCGAAAAEAIVAQRQEKGPYRSLFDFCSRLDSGTVNRTAIESLIKAGAFDSLGARRAQLFAVIDRAMQSGAAAAADRRAGQLGLFDTQTLPSAPEDSLPNVPEWAEREKLAKEKEVLGFYVSGHPLAEYEQLLKTYCSHTTVQAAALPHRSEVLLGGMVTALQFRHPKTAKPGAPNRYATFELEDTEGMIRCICWSEQLLSFESLLQQEALLAAAGTIEKRPGSQEANLIISQLMPLAELPERTARAVVIHFSESTHGEAKLGQLYEVLRGYPGRCELRLMVHLADGRRVTLECDKLRLEINPEMRRRVEQLLGPGHFHLLAEPFKSWQSGSERMPCREGDIWHCPPNWREDRARACPACLFGTSRTTAPSGSSWVPLPREPPKPPESSACFAWFAQLGWTCSLVLAARISMHTQPQDESGLRPTLRSHRSLSAIVVGAFGTQVLQPGEVDYAAAARGFAYCRVGGSSRHAVGGGARHPAGRYRRRQAGGRGGRCPGSALDQDHCRSRRAVDPATHCRGHSFPGSGCGPLQQIAQDFAHAPGKGDPGPQRCGDRRDALSGRSAACEIRLLLSRDQGHRHRRTGRRLDRHSGCSIDPTEEGLASMQRFLRSIGSYATPADTQYIVQGLQTSLGLQTVSINGVPPDTHFAQVMVEADYRMKLIGIGLERPPVRLVSYVERANPATVSRNALVRWYFTPDYQCVRVSEDGLAMELVGDGVKVVGEDELVAASGQRQATGRINLASRAFVTSFTQKYPELAERSPVFAELRNLIDLAIAAAYIQKADLYGKAGWTMPLFGDEKKFAVRTYQAPKRVATAVNAIWKGNRLMTPIGGGVSINAAKALESDKLLPDEAQRVKRTRESIRLELAEGQWWWD